MKICKKCGKEITEENILIKRGYVMNSCKKCEYKASVERHARRVAEGKVMSASSRNARAKRIAELDDIVAECIKKGISYGQMRYMEQIKEMRSERAEN